MYCTVMCTVLWAGQVYQKKSWHTVLADSAVSCSCALRAHVEYISVSCVDHDMLFVSGAMQGDKKGMYREHKAYEETNHTSRMPHTAAF